MEYVTEDGQRIFGSFGLVSLIGRFNGVLGTDGLSIMMGVISVFVDFFVLDDCRRVGEFKLTRFLICFEVVENPLDLFLFRWVVLIVSEGRDGIVLDVICFDIGGSIR